MGLNRHLLLTTSFLGTFSCLPSAVPIIEITIPGETVQIIDQGYSAPISLPPLPELIQNISKECSSKGCAFYFPEESIGMNYHFSAECLSTDLEQKECLEVIVGSYGGGETMAYLMTDYQPFGPVDSVLLVKPTGDIVEISPDEVTKFDLLYEKSILAGFSYDGRDFVSPQDLRKIHQLLSRCSVVQ